MFVPTLVLCPIHCTVTASMADITSIEVRPHRQFQYRCSPISYDIFMGDERDFFHFKVLHAHQSLIHRIPAAWRPQSCALPHCVSHAGGKWKFLRSTNEEKNEKTQ